MASPNPAAPRADELDAEIAAALKEQAERFGIIELTDLPPAQARPLFLARNAMFNNKRLACATRDFTMATHVGALAAREYRAPGAQAAGAILYFHGGGWTFGNIDSHDALLRCLAHDTGDAIIAIDYRLAPEHPFPAPLDDCVDAFDWCVANADKLGIAAERIAVGGDSAGANLALAVALARRDSAVRPAAMLLYYGCFQTNLDTASHRQFGDGRFGLSSERMRRFWANYIGATLEPSPLSAPLTADLRGLPPAYLMAAGLDVLYDDTMALAAALEKAGVPYALEVHRGCHHGFLHMVERAAVARAAVKGSAAFWRTRTR